MIRRKQRASSGAAPEELRRSLEALREAVELASERLPEQNVASAREVLTRAEQRGSLAAGRTVVALLGATGSGKSSLFNTLVGRAAATVAPRRPTTTRPMAAVWGTDDAAALLDWLGVPERVHVDEPDVEGLVLLDLPDIDSTSTAHREVAARMAGTVDVLVWVLDPQKYADAVVHRDYLTPMAEYAEATIVVLNQVDTLSSEDHEAVLADLRGILQRDGLGGVELMAVSAREGTGVPQLRERIEAVAAGHAAARVRLAADVRTAAGRLSGALGTDGARAEVPATERQRLEMAAARAAGVEAVRDAVRGSHVRAARRHVGWPPVRWVQRLRPDPLRRLHLQEVPDAELTRTSLPAATPVQEAAVRSSAHTLLTSTTKHLPTTWRAQVVRSAEDRLPRLVSALDTAIAGTDLELPNRPRWWRVFGALQWLSLTAVVVGGLWLGALAGMAYLQLPEPTTPVAGPVPWPTVLLLGGILLGVFLAVIGGAAARVGARRRARRVERRIHEAVRGTVEAHLLQPLHEELDAHARLLRLLEGLGPTASPTS